MTIYETFDELEAMADHQIQGSEFVGDPMDENSTNSTTRIYIQNLNGLTWKKRVGAGRTYVKCWKPSKST